MTSLHLGSLTIRPAERSVTARGRTIAVEPLVMQLLVCLAERAGALVTRRDLFTTCWGTAPVGDDSLNRLVAVLRRTLKSLSGEEVQVQTVAGTGYVLRLREADGTSSAERSSIAADALGAAWDSWRLGLPRPDYLVLEQLRLALTLAPDSAALWGIQAALLRHATEYAPPKERAQFVDDCDHAIRRALAIEPHQPAAATARATIAPLFGGWSSTRHALLDVLQHHPRDPMARQELATLEMATGRIRASKSLRDALIAEDPLAAVYGYKSVYQHWSIGDLAGMDRAAEHAMALWPMHPAVWSVRFWTLAYTGRLAAAEQLLDSADRPNVPPPAARLMRDALHGASRSRKDEEAMAGSFVTAAGTGPANAVAALFALGLIGRVDEQFDIAERYYLGMGAAPVPVHHTADELSLNEQHRRLTQVLFTPVFARARERPRFTALCERIGLSAYWQEHEFTPDFMMER